MLMDVGLIDEPRPYTAVEYGVNKARQRWRRRGRDVRILQEVSVSVSGSVYEERSPSPDSDEADAFCFMPVEERERERDEADEKH